MSLFWKRKSITPSTDSTIPILDAPIHPDEASSLNNHPALAASNSTQSSLQSHHQIQPSDCLIDFSNDTIKSSNNMTTATLGESIHIALDGANNTTSAEGEKAQLTPTQQKRRNFFGFGKKKQQSDDETPRQTSPPPTSVPPITTTSPIPETVDRGTNSTASPVSPVRSSHFGSQRGLGKNTSPRLSTSSIFERNVQDPSLLPPGSPSIHSHFSTENYIPPVLEATSLAITDLTVDPDRVEILSSTSHHPVLAHPESYANPWADDSATHSGDESIGHGYSSPLASADKRRLSFISFADVVQAENEQASHSTTNLDAVSQRQQTASLRSLSPVRTPPPHPPHSPPGTGLGITDFSMEKDMSIPDRASGSVHNEVTVETLSQALRKHGSSDLKATVKSQTHSISGGDIESNPWRD